MNPQDYLDGLRRERKNHERAGRTDRVDQVDDEIGRVTGKHPRRIERAVSKRKTEKRG